MSFPRFQSVLVANRGEIAERVIRSAKRLGYRSIAIYSDADKDAPYTRLADVTVAIGASPAAESYLDIEKVLGAAKSSGAEAIHPGYGFLSENAAFARACTDAGLIFIGPSADAIEKMGDKARAKRLLESSVPLLPGYQGDDQELESLAKEAKSLGAPLMIKAAAGGGGKGMRLVEILATLPEDLESARREAIAAFGCGDLILERAALRPRHVEIQIIGDEAGTVLSLGERDCSVQRRHQKVIEEAPSPAVNSELRQKMSQAAVEAAKAVKYVGAGTVEFLLCEDGQFYFLEMNTRLQVEHPVTEMVTGLDLVGLQLSVAQGHPLPLTQDDVKLQGHAIEVRLYAEDPNNDFLPCTGRLHTWDFPDSVRVDGGVESGSEVTAFYDPMLAKIIAHGETRDDARRKLVAALKAGAVLGLANNRSFLIDALSVPAFVEGQATTAFISEWDRASSATLSGNEVAAAAGALQFARDGVVHQRSPGLTGWSNSPWIENRLILKLAGESFELALRRDGADLIVRHEESVYRVEMGESAQRVNGERFTTCLVLETDDSGFMKVGPRDLQFQDVTLPCPDSEAEGGSGVLVAPMHGRVVASDFEVGDKVSKGDRVLVMEAMKMEQALVADIDGVIEYVAEKDSQVAAGETVVKIQQETPSKV
ncbi:MAG: biotin carboxylase N-terminal domain-containing protein [Planctomycetota bacterium]|nr:biotin carboxylase N-terminal domain-containing protein [Planctomycetota bacterium]